MYSTVLYSTLLLDISIILGYTRYFHSISIYLNQVFLKTLEIPKPLQHQSQITLASHEIPAFREDFRLITSDLFSQPRLSVDVSPLQIMIFSEDLFETLSHWPHRTSQQSSLKTAQCCQDCWTFFLWQAELYASQIRVVIKLTAHTSSHCWARSKYSGNGGGRREGSGASIHL